jgi:ubiquinone/menaquinone biosynthesis C-methylase UbiE
MENNQHVYESDRVIREYASHQYLQKAEHLIFNTYDEKIRQGSVLDIGIGGGRTSHYLIPRSRKYTGIDFAGNMVEHCRAAFREFPDAEFHQADARALSLFADESFDFVLFSFNGIDCVGFEDRKKIVSECHRVLKPGGIFMFSFHNTGNLDALYSFQWPKNPLKYGWEWTRRKKIRAINGPKEQYEDKPYFILRDGADDFTTDVLYIRPSLQDEQLKELHLLPLGYWDALTAKPVDISASGKMPWIYVTCSKRS